MKTVLNYIVNVTIKEIWLKYASHQRKQNIKDKLKVFTCLKVLFLLYFLKVGMKARDKDLKKVKNALMPYILADDRL